MDEDKRRTWRQFELKKRSKNFKRGAKRVEGATTRHARRFLVNRWDKIRDVRLHIILWLGGVGFLIALVGLQMMWFQRGYITTAPVNGGTYAEAVKGPIQTLNPLFATTPAELSASHLLFSSLYTNDTTGHLHGDIATGMTVETDKVFTVKLRHDARWDDGQALTATDVVFTVGLMKNPAVRSIMTASWQGIDVRAIDDYTVQFTLPAQYAAFPQALTFAIVPQHLLATVDPANLRESGFSSAPIGSGPFSLRLLQVISQTADRKIVHMDANNDYYAGRPRVDKFQLHAYKDDDGIARALRTGEVTAASDVSGDVANSVDTKKYDITVRPLNSGVYALFNMNQPALKDPAVRKALQMVTDTAAIRKELYGKPQALYLPFVNGQVPGTESIAPPVHDNAAAAKLLTDSGWVMQGDVRTKGADKLRLKIVTRKNGDYEAALRVLAGQWRNLGVQVDTQVFDTTDASQSFTQDVLRPRNYDVLIDELVIGNDPDVFAYWHSRGLLNFSNYGNLTSDDALTSARTRSDPALRAVKYTAFARQWLSDAPAIGLYQSDFIYVDSKTTHAIQPDSAIVTADEHYADVRYWTSDLGSVYKTP
ncbi:MAG: putative Extracellular solute-binding protein family 5 [Candidatus Saccharibacteria bacterium]|nr:putative Extracellular solute-binding protein family 5 [Candidatus Saccharibacteria bacterium]